MTLQFDSVAWRLNDPAAFVAEYESKPPIGRALFALGCTHCVEICTIGLPCRCCKDIGTKAGGTGRIIRGIQHLHKRFPIAEVLDQIRRAA